MVAAELCVKGIYSDGMVLQRNTTNCIFGKAEANAEVILSFREINVSSKADLDGSWKIEFNPGEAGGPFTLSVSCKDKKIVYSDVYVGEVWLSSGQSNAQLQMERMKFSYPDEFKLPENPFVRMITIPISWSFEGEQDSVQNPTWLCASPSNLGALSGTAYFFAKKLSQDLGIPVGIINASQGGSPISAWMNKKSLQELDCTKPLLENLSFFEKPENITAKQKETALLHQKWNENIKATDRGQNEHWEKLSYSEVQNDWEDCTIPGFIDHKETAGFVWFKKQVDLTAEQVSHFNAKKTWIWFGTIVDADKIWVNGVEVGGTGYCYPPRRYVIPAGTLKEGHNTVTVQVQKNSRFGRIRFYDEKPYFIFTDDVKIVPTAVRNVEHFTEVTPSDGEKINLQGQWKMKMGTSVDDNPPELFLEWVPTALYNAMLSPCFNYAISGALWYQGESDAGHPQEYQKMLTKMIKLWREKFVYAKKDMPFVVMQLPNWSDGHGENYTSQVLGCAQMRQVQKTVSETVKNCGLSVIIDAGEWNDLHPEKKRTGGTRAAMEALRIGYGKNYNPSPKAIKISNKENDLLVKFETGTASLKTLTGSEIPGFCVVYQEAGAEKISEAKGTLVSDTEVLVKMPKVNGKVKALSYLFADSPNPINLYSTDELPAQPFYLSI